MPQIGQRGGDVLRQPHPLARWKLGSKVAETLAELLDGCDEDTATALLDLMRAGLKLTGRRVAEG